MPFETPIFWGFPLLFAILRRGFGPLLDSRARIPLAHQIQKTLPLENRVRPGAIAPLADVTRPVSNNETFCALNGQGLGLGSSAMLTLEYLVELARKHETAISAQVREFSIGDVHFAFNRRPAIMGVINLSPDSWYRESVCLTAEAAVLRGKILHAQGAHIIDVGAESTLPHAARLDAAAQRKMLLPVIEQLRAARIIVSAETYSKEVARASLEAGARVLNLTGTQDAAEIYRMAAEHSAAVIVCYVQGPNVREVTDFQYGGDVIAQMLEHFARQVELAGKQGLEKILIDPGLGFYYANLQDGASRVARQIEVFLNTFRLRALGFPVCHALPHAFEYFAEEVRCAEPFFAVLAALGKTDLFRTHEVRRVKAVLDTLGNPLHPQRQTNSNDSNLSVA
jgi:dihydropteroate synthase